MWPFNSKCKQPINEFSNVLCPCPICNSNDLKYSCQPSEYFNYKIEIQCKKCQFEQCLYGSYEKISTPENFKKDWEDFINVWNRGKK